MLVRMTLSMAWVRRLPTGDELVFASDSRLRGGESWDSSPKVLQLPRTDSLISFAGKTYRAYPLMLQLVRAIRMHEPSRERRVPLPAAKGHALRVMNQMVSQIDDLPEGQERPDDLDFEFILGGYSWQESKFRIWTLHRDESLGELTFRPAVPWAGQGTGHKVLAIIGDVAQEAHARLQTLLERRGKLGMGHLDMEPFEVLRDMLRSGEFPTIGGAPQVAKVYPYLQSALLPVMWPDKDGTPHAAGRPALSYETFPFQAIDPDAPGRSTVSVLGGSEINEEK